MDKLAYKIAYFLFLIKSELKEYRVNRLINKAYKRYVSKE